MSGLTGEQRDEFRRLSQIPVPVNYYYVSPLEEQLTLSLRHALSTLLDAADELAEIKGKGDDRG